MTRWPFPAPKGHVGHPDLTQNIGQTLDRYANFAAWSTLAVIIAPNVDHAASIRTWTTFPPRSAPADAGQHSERR